MSRKKENRKAFSTTVKQEILDQFEKIVLSEGLVKTKAVDKAIELYIETYHAKSNNWNKITYSAY